MHGFDYCIDHKSIHQSASRQQARQGGKWPENRQERRRGEREATSKNILARGIAKPPRLQLIERDFRQGRATAPVTAGGCPARQISEVEARAYEKFYTRPDVAALCVATFKGFLPRGATVVDPCAGAGSFIEHDPDIIAYDIWPEGPNIVQVDFFDLDLARIPNLAILTNPPFGERCAMLIRFLNRALRYANFVGVIVPVSFDAVRYRRQIDPEARLVYAVDLPDDAFTFLGEPYKVKSRFEVWSKSDLRIRNKSPVRHADFELHLSKRPGQDGADPAFDWDLAIQRTGFPKIVVDRGGLNPKRQYLFIKCRSRETMEALKAINWRALAVRKMGSPKLGKGDVVSAYIQFVTGRASRDELHRRQGLIPSKTPDAAYDQNAELAQTTSSNSAISDAFELTLAACSVAVLVGCEPANDDDGDERTRERRRIPRRKMLRHQRLRLTRHKRRTVKRWAAILEPLSGPRASSSHQALPSPAPLDIMALSNRDRVRKPRSVRAPA